MKKGAQEEEQEGAPQSLGGKGPLKHHFGCGSSAGRGAPPQKEEGKHPFHHLRKRRRRKRRLGAQEGLENCGERPKRAVETGEPKRALERAQWRDPKKRRVPKQARSGGWRDPKRALERAHQGLWTGGNPSAQLRARSGETPSSKQSQTEAWRVDTRSGGWRQPKCALVRARSGECRGPPLTKKRSVEAEESPGSAQWRAK